MCQLPPFRFEPLPYPRNNYTNQVHCTVVQLDSVDWSTDRREDMVGKSLEKLKKRFYGGKARISKGERAISSNVSQSRLSKCLLSYGASFNLIQVLLSFSKQGESCVLFRTFILLCLHFSLAYTIIKVIKSLISRPQFPFSFSLSSSIETMHNITQIKQKIKMLFAGCSICHISFAKLLRNP